MDNEPMIPPPLHSTDLSIGKTKVGDLDYTTAGMLSYLPLGGLNLVIAVVLLVTEPQNNRFLRFHAVQSAILTGAFLLLVMVAWFINSILGFIPFLGGVISFCVNLIMCCVAAVYLWKSIVAMLDTKRGNMRKIEYIGDVAEQLLGG